MYTAPDRTRRIRVHTLALPTAGSIGGIFRGADLEATVQTVAGTLVTLPLPGGSLFSCRTALEQRCVDILTAYRLHCAVRSNSEGQLILPESLKLMPVNTCMLLKAAPLATGIAADARAAALFRWATATPRGFSQAVQPRLIDVCAAHEQPDGRWLPAAYLPVSSEFFAASGIYLLDNAREVCPLSPCARTQGLPRVQCTAPCAGVPAAPDCGLCAASTPSAP